MAGGKASGQKLSLTKRRLAVLALRIQGATYREIAAHLKESGEIELPKSYCYSQARRDAMYMLRLMNKQATGYVAEIRRLNLVRLDELLFSMWTSAVEGDYMAFDRVMAVIREQVKMEGLAAPEKIALTDPTGTKPIVLDNDARADALAVLLAKLGIEVTDIEEPADDEPATGDV